MTPEQQLLIQHPETIIECKMVEIIRDLEEEIERLKVMTAKMQESIEYNNKFYHATVEALKKEGEL